MQILIDNNTYYIPDTFNEVLLHTWIELVNCSKKAPDEDATEKEKIDFYIEFCSVFISKDILKKCKIVDDELGLIGLFNHLWQFVQTPAEDNTPAQYLTAGGNMYKFAQDTLDLSLEPMQNATYEEYEEATAVMTALSKLEDPNNLALLVAIFYRPVIGWIKKKCEPYDSDTVEARAELFKSCLFMNDVWSCYFFFQQQTSTSVLSTVAYLEKEMEKQVV